MRRATYPQPEPESNTKGVAPLLPARYVVQRKLGEGGCAQVYAAYDQVVGRLVAVKWLPFGGDQQVEAEALKLLQAEARITGRLSHPNILNVYDCGVTAAGCYLVMEYCHGRDLFSIVQSEGKLSKEVAISTISNLVDCLAYVHRKGVIHGDITPSNVLVSWDGMTKLLDFGVGSFRHRQAQTRWVTLIFAAPEVVQDGKLTPASDVFSLGATAVFALTGEVPKIEVTAPGEQIASKWQCLAEQRIDDAELCRWLLRALQTDPAQRPSAEKWRDTMPMSLRYISPQKTAARAVKSSARDQLHSRSPVRILTFVWEWFHRAVMPAVQRIPIRRMIFAAQTGTITYFLHNLSLAGNVLFPVFSSKTRQVLTLTVGALSFASLRLGLFILVWSFLPVLVSEVVGWALVYGVLALITTPIIQFFPQVSLQILFFPLANALSAGLGMSLLVGRWLGPIPGSAVGACGRFLACFLQGIAQSPFMGRLLQYGLLTSAAQLGIVASIQEGIIPGIRYCVSWPQAGYIITSAAGGVLTGLWRPRGAAEFLLHTVTLVVTLALLQWAMGLSIAWEELLVSILVYMGVGFLEIVRGVYGLERKR